MTTPSFIKKLFAKALRVLGISYIPSKLAALAERSPVDKASQILLTLKYRELLFNRQPLPRFSEIEFRAYSQNGEDGILLYIFALIGTENKTCVEICAGGGTVCNSANLIINHGWTGLLVDGNENAVRSGRKFYSAHPDTSVFPPKFASAWVTAENINSLIASHGIGGRIDLLSLDLDGVDYWIWKAIEQIQPRVVVVETQVIWDEDHCVTVPYSANFKAEYYRGYGCYSGASLSALVKLANNKGYRLVGCQRYGYNVFFMKNEIGVGIFPAVSVKECLCHPFVAWAKSELLPIAEKRIWEEV